MDEIIKNPEPGQPTYTVKTDEEIKKAHKKSVISVISMICLFIIVLFGGLYLLSRINAPEVNTEMPAAPVITPKQPILQPPVINEPAKPSLPENKIESPESVVQVFYNWYITNKNEAYSDDNLLNQGNLDKDFAEKIKTGDSKPDPFLCSDEQTGFEVEPAVISGNSATIIVNIKDKNVIPVTIGLISEGGSWKINSASCPSPDDETSILENLKAVTGLDYVTVETVIFPWNLPDYKGVKTISLNGKEISTSDASIDPSVINNYFLKNGFTKDRYNDYGYSEKQTVCLDSGVTDPSGKYNLKIDCGKLAL